MITLSSNFYDFEQLHKTTSIKDIARQLRVGQQALKRVLQSKGYEYDTSIKKWRYVLIDDVNNNRNQSIYNAMYQAGSDAIVSVNNINSNNESNTDAYEHDSISNTDDNTNSNTFTEDEIAILKRIASDWTQQHTNNNNDIVQALQSVKRDKTERKTFAISASIITQLDNFCEENNIKKSDFLAVAILNAIKKYS